MIKTLRTRFFGMLQNAMREVDCPSCHHRFQPFAHEKLESFAQLSRGSVCPKCGKQFQWTDRDQPGTTARGNAVEESNIIVQPTDSKIERREISESELLYHLPASGRWGALLFFAIVWNLVSIPFLCVAIYASLRGRANVATLVAVPLCAVGFGSAYAAIRTRFARHLIYLGPETVRVQRALFRKKNFVFRTDEIQHVKKVEIYKQNYQPVFAIEIAGANNATVRFGSVLSDGEKTWFCADAIMFLRKVGARL
jgi:DNA-directed RNA polymerase subunit RPC12/RpoP